MRCALVTGVQTCALPIYLDTQNTAYFGHCAKHEFHLQQCAKCDLLHYPPTTTCPFCGNPEQHWSPVEGRGTVYSYVEVHHAIQPGFKGHTPYMVLLVELDTQKGRPTGQDALRVAGNFVTRSDEHTAELQYLMRNSYADF